MLRISALWLIAFLIFLAFSCQHVEEKYNFDIQLNSGWKFRKPGEKNFLPAIVPGNVVSDLLSNNKIENPFFQNNATRMQWIVKADWEYQTTFVLDPDILSYDSIQLCFQGLDAYADVYLNDSLLIKSNNVFRLWTVECKSILKETDNQLRVYFHYDRFNFGAPLIARGMCWPVHLRAWSIAKISDVYIHPKQITKKNAEYFADFVISSSRDQYANIELLVNSKLVHPPKTILLKKGQNQQQIIFSIEDPKLWWTNGLGHPYLYDFSLRVRKEQNIIDERHQRLGIRTVELVQKPDSLGNDLYFKLNGIPIFIKGTNYYPSDILPARGAYEVYQRLLEDARIANINMIRVRGGSVYEDDLFYDLCDEKGILVWQDFMLTGSILSDDGVDFENIRQTAVLNVKRLRNHACLSLWCGNNENLGGAMKKPCPKEVDKQANNYEKLFYQLLPLAVSDYDSQTAYWVSPEVKLAALPGQSKVDFLQDTNNKEGRYFIIEEGMPSLSSSRTIKMFVRAEDMQLRSEPMNARLHNNLPISCILDKDGAILDNVCKNYKVPKDFESFVYLSQLVQSDALKVVVENYRRNMTRCSGLIYSQLNDCQPAISSSTIDYYGRWKLAHYVIQNAYAHILVIPVRENNLVNIYAASDALRDMDAILLAKVIDFKGKVLYAKQIPVDLKANSSNILLSVKESEMLKNADKSKCCLVVQLNQPNLTLSQNILYFTLPKNLTLPEGQLTIDVNEAGQGFNLILKSDKLTKNIYLSTISKESYFSDNNFDLLPEKRMKINVQYQGTKKEFLKDLKIRSLVDIK